MPPFDVKTVADLDIRTTEQFTNMQNIISTLTERVQQLESSLALHNHDGIMSQQIQIDDIAGYIQTASTATELSNRTATAPQNAQQQIFIDTSTATKRLYIYDTVGSVWYKVTIA